jgi:hypothetical protein
VITPFDQNRPLTHHCVEGATVIAFGTDRAKGVCRPAGVLDANDNPVPLAQCWRDSRQAVTSSPPPHQAQETLSGTWLYGGMLYAHFGHFLCESTARLWALDLPGISYDGLILLPKPLLTRMKRIIAPTQPWLAVAGATLPVQAPASPVRVERLIIPEQGFGTGDMVAGRPEQRAYLHRHFGATIQPEGSERLYISRSRLFSKRGRILGERFLETALAAEGYDVFHPQDHPIEVQIARYKAARSVISTDCSALHLSAFFARPDDRVAILARRPGPTIGDFIAQYRAFCGLTPCVIDRLTALHGLEGAKLAQMSEVYAEADYPALRQDLIDGGFISGSHAWDMPTPHDIQTELHDYADRQNTDLRNLDLSA